MDGAIALINKVIPCNRANHRQNNERPELLRVQDARAALPQNCSPTKIRRLQNLAYGTIGLHPPLRCHPCKQLIIKGARLISYSRHRFENLKSLWIWPISDSVGFPQQPLCHSSTSRKSGAESWRVSQQVCASWTRKRESFSGAMEQSASRAAFVMRWSDDHASQNRFCIAIRPTGNIARKSARLLKA